jgi:hypothetical protein
LNRFGEVYENEKCCIDMPNTAPNADIISNCSLRFSSAASRCTAGDGVELNGDLPYYKMPYSLIDTPKTNVDIHLRFIRGNVDLRIEGQDISLYR